MELYRLDQMRYEEVVYTYGFNGFGLRAISGSPGSVLYLSVIDEMAN